MRKCLSLGMIGLFIVYAFGCSSSKQFTDGSFQFLEPDKRLLVMPPNVSLGEFTTLGRFEAREEWTAEASNNVALALQAQLSNRSGQTEFLSASGSSANAQALVDSLIELHKAVGPAIYLHNFFAKLPTKAGQLDWTMGEKAVSLGEETGHDYALFFNAFNGYSTAGRVALQASVTLLTCGTTPVCLVAMSGAPKNTYFSLVDLHSGQVVWFSGNVGDMGDLRSIERSNQIVERLLSPLNADQSTER